MCFLAVVESGLEAESDFLEQFFDEVDRRDFDRTSGRHRRV
jgi:hypothetical protein